jgi:hypothetical protein
MPREPNLLALPKRNLMAMVPGGGLELSHPTEKKQVIENSASNKPPKLAIRGYLVSIT